MAFLSRLPIPLLPHHFQRESGDVKGKNPPHPGWIKKRGAYSACLPASVRLSLTILRSSCPLIRNAALCGQA